MFFTYQALFQCVSFLLFCLKVFFIILISLKIFQVLTAGKCRSMRCLVGKTAIVTGGSSGMGFETALVLASRGCRVIIADKNISQKPKEEIIARTGNPNVEIKFIDLASLKTVRQFAKELNETEEKIDILINNAGVGAIGNKFTEDGLHSTMQINHFGPFLLTHLLVDLLKKSGSGRVVFVSSMLAFASNLTKENLNYEEDHPLSFFEICLVYANSKLCNVIASNCFAERLQRSGITVNSLHPGSVDTNIYTTFIITNKYDAIVAFLKRIVLRTIGKTPQEGIQTALHLAISEEVEGVTGKHFWDCKEFAQPPKAWNKMFCEEIWEESEKLVGLRKEERLELFE